MISSRARVLIAVLLAAGVVAGAVGVVHLPFGDRQTQPVHFVVAEGSSLNRVARDLERDGLVRSAWIFRVWARVTGRERSVRSGEYELRRGASMARILDALVEGPLLTRAVTLPEGWTRGQAVRALSEALELDAAGLDSLTLDPPPDWRARLDLPDSATLEGYLFPETYRFVAGVSARTVVGSLVDGFVAAFDDSMRARAADFGFTVHEVVTLASIVEAEALIDSERPAVAAVYLNRLERGWKLEADPTVAYAVDKIGERLTFRDLEVDSPYNTYRRTGLPPGPINSPGRASLRAVLWPAPDFDAMYFVADGQGGHRFSRTWQEHQAAVREYRSIQRQRRGRAGGGG
jgi:UPF0755 protein